MAKKRRMLGQILLKKGKITQEQLEEALEYQEEHGCRLGEALIKLKHADPETIAKAIAKQNSLPYVNLTGGELSKSLVESVPKDVVSEHFIVPVKKKGRSLIVASADPLDYITLENLRFLLDVDSVECAIASHEALTMLISKYYGLEDKIDDMIQDLTNADIAVRDDLEDLEVPEDEEDGDAPVIRLVNLIISEAVKKRTSDIHIEPMEKKLRVRYRIDGMCVEQESPPKKLQNSIIARVKIMAKMDMAEKRRPQDGRIKMKCEGREIDLRVNSLPATHGESVVLRILDKEKALKDLEDLGLHETDYNRFQKIIKRPNGIFLVTGPTGSGKTTTLYAALKKLNRPEVKIITAEHPIEYNLPGINQAEVKHQIGMTFAKILKAMLRQAPNIILVGEIRDKETAETAIQAALTGHLVFSTLHTNDAPSAITRLIDMDVKPFLVASSVIAVLAQRLIRLLCPSCKQPYEPSEAELRSVGLSREEAIGKQFYNAVGCEDCGQSGYKGRQGVYELMEVDSQMRELIFASEPTERIREYALSSTMTSLQQDALRKVMEGKSTIDEVLRLTHRADLTLEY
ncbi:MAG: type II/IV secretion system protein [Planctomycetota bacterium]|nr:MAG: type II/IV secretion system protein [Planctomycetota bacterium]